MRRDIKTKIEKGIISIFFNYKNRKQVAELAVSLLFAAIMYELVVYLLVFTHSNWAGYSAVSNVIKPQPLVTAVYGSWVVQNTTDYTSALASQWIGIGGLGKQYYNDTTLIQIGTEYRPSNNVWNYVGWYELIYPNSPVNSEVITIPKNVLNISPNDIIFASIVKSNKTQNNAWIISLNDLTTGTHFNKSVNYKSSQLSADWVEESGTIGNRVWALSNFKTAYFGSDYTGIKTTNYATMANKTLSMGDYEIIPYNSFNYGGLTATISPISEDGTSFKVNFQSSLGQIGQILYLFYLVFILLGCALVLFGMYFYMEFTKNNIITFEDNIRNNMYTNWGRAYNFNLKQAKEHLMKSLKNEINTLRRSGNKKLSKNFFKMAGNDIRAARLLYTFRNYGLAVFHFQQAVEKTTKGALLLEDVELRKTHSAIEMYEHWYSDIFNDTQIKASQGRTDFKTYNARIIISALTRTTQILISAVDRQYDRQPELFNTLFQGDNFKWRVNYVNKQFTNYFNNTDRQNRIRMFNDHEIMQLTNKVKNINNLDMAIELVPLFQELLESVEMLCALTILTLPHEQTSRYDMEMYNKKLGIVKMLPILLNKIDYINKLWLGVVKN